MGSAFRKLPHAVRSLMGDKGFTVTVVLTIAVCIAANIATFAVVNSVLLRPLPLPDARSVLLMANRYPKAGADFGYNSASGNYYDRLRASHVCSEQALFRTTGHTLDIQGTPQRVTGMEATPSLFRLLRVSPAFGRAFSDAEGEPGANHKTILSDGLSRQIFGSPEAAIGRGVRMGGQPFTVVGVMPAGFNFIDPEVRLWVPAAFTPEEREVRHSNNWQSVGRLKPGATLHCLPGRAGGSLKRIEWLYVWRRYVCFTNVDGPGGRVGHGTSRLRPICAQPLRVDSSGRAGCIPLRDSRADTYRRGRWLPPPTGAAAECGPPGTGAPRRAHHQFRVGNSECGLRLRPGGARRRTG